MSKEIASNPTKILVSNRSWHSGVTRGHVDTFWYEETCHDGGRPRRSFRATIKRNTYDHQSFGRVEMWTVMGWQEVVRYEMSFLDSRHVRPVNNPVFIERFAVTAPTDVDRMLHEAREITGAGEG